MIQDNDPVVSQFISVPKESGLNCAAFTAGVVEAILERSQFVRNRAFKHNLSVIVAKSCRPPHLPAYAPPAGTGDGALNAAAQSAVPDDDLHQI